MELDDVVHRLLAASWEVVTFVDDDGVVTFQSDASETVLGTAPDRFVGESVFDIPVEQDREVVRECFESVRADPDAVASAELRYASPEGPVKVLESRFVNLGDRIAVYTRDVTNRVLDETRLELLLTVSRQLMLASSPDEIAEIAVQAAKGLLELPLTGIHLYDDTTESLRPVRTTEAVVELFDGDVPVYTRDDETVWSVFESEDAVVIDDVATLPDVRARDTPSQSVVIIGLGDHGVFITSSEESHAFDDTDVYFAKLLAQNVQTALDAAERESALHDREVELVEQNARLDAFARVLSHDLRNPLSVATGYLEMYQETGDEEHFDRVETALERIDAIIGDVLSLARDGTEEMAHVECDIAAVAEDAWHSIERDDVSLDVNAENVIEGDPSRLQRLFENLFRNAVDHAAGNGRLTITVGDVGERGFFVADDGVGIPADVRERVFDAGFTTTDHGTGLGLSIVKQIAVDHGLEPSLRVEDGTRIEFTPTD